MTTRWIASSTGANKLRAALAAVDALLDDRAALLAMCKRLCFNLTSVSLMGHADDKRAALCAEARALIQQMEKTQ